MSADGSRPRKDTARVRLRLAALTVMSVVTIGFIGSGAAADVGAELFAQESTTTVTLLPGSSSTTEEPTTTEFLDPTTTEAEPTTTDAAPTSTRRETTTTADVDDLESTSTTEVREVTASTVRDLLVPGDGTEGAESTTTTSTTVVSVADGGDDGGLSESTMLWLVVGGLVLIALLVAIWTVRFWQATRPEAEVPGATPGPSADVPPEDPTTVFPTA